MGFLKRPKAPEPTAQELAGVERQARMLDEETDEIEKRLKAVARGKLGSKSLLAKAKSSTSSGSTSSGSMLSGGGSGAGGGGGGGGNSGITSNYGSGPTTNRK